MPFFDIFEDNADTIFSHECWMQPATDSLKESLRCNVLSKVCLALSNSAQDASSQLPSDKIEEKAKAILACVGNTIEAGSLPQIVFERAGQSQFDVIPLQTGAKRLKEFFLTDTSTPQETSDNCDHIIQALIAAKIIPQRDLPDPALRECSEKFEQYISILPSSLLDEIITAGNRTDDDDPESQPVIDFLGASILCLWGEIEKMKEGNAYSSTCEGSPGARWKKAKTLYASNADDDFKSNLSGADENGDEGEESGSDLE